MKTISYLVIFVAQLIAPQILLSQQFQKLHDCDTSSDFGGHIFVRPDGSYLAFSSSQSYTTNRREAVWAEISQDGSLLSNMHKVFSTQSNYYIGYISGEAKSLQNGDYISPISVADVGQKSGMGLIRLNNQLDTVFTKFYTDTNLFREDIASCTVMPNGDFISGGFSAPNNVFMDSAIIIRTDSMGNLIWKKKYKKVANQEAAIMSLQALDDYRILVGAVSTYYVWLNQFDSYNHSSPWFMIIDSMGNIIKDTLYSGTYGGGGWICKDMYGGYLIRGAYDSCVTTDPLDKVNFPEYVANLNDDFEIEWIHNFGTWDGHKYIWRMEQLPDGNIQVSGANGTDQTSLRGWAARLNHNGWTIWDNDYLCDTNWSSYLVDFDVRQDGSLIMVGAARNDTVPQWRGQEMWLVSVDANGCLIPGCAPTMVKETATPKDDELLVYPNPTTGEFYLEAPEDGSISLYDMIGRRLVKYNVQKGKSQLSFPDGVAAGNYLLQFTGRESGMMAGKGIIRTGIH